MAFVYILRSEPTGRYYVGSTNDLGRRLEEHERGHSLATRGRDPGKLVYQESLPTVLDARRRENEIKGWKSSKLITRLIANRAG